MGTRASDPGAGGGEGGGAAAACSICLEALASGGERSTVRLHCGHEFHLDCIGSAFNAKGMMQCPNCRKIEKGNWLYAKGSHSYSEPSLDAWTHDEDFYDINLDMQLRFHWCPFRRSPQSASSFEEVEASPETAYHGLSGHNAILADHTIPTAVHSCPYMSHFQLLQPFSSSDSYISGSLFEGDAYQHHQRHVVGSTDAQTSHALPGQESFFDGWEHHPFPHVPRRGHTASGPDQPSVSSTTRATGYDSHGRQSWPIYQLFGHGPVYGTGLSDSSSLVAPNLASSRPQAQANEHYQHQGSLSMHDSISDLQQSGGTRSSTPIGPTPHPALQHSGYYLFPHSDSSGRIFQDVDGRLGNQLYAWERGHFAPFPLMNVDRGAAREGTLPHASGASSSGSRVGFRHRHDSERSAMEGRIDASSYGPDHGPYMHHFI